MTIAQIIDIAKVSQYLCTADIVKGGLNGGGIDLLLPRKLYSLRKNTEYRYVQEDIAGGNTPTQALVSVANKLFSLCYKSMEASAIAGAGGGGSVSPVSPTGSPTPLSFEVSGSSPIITGGSVLNLNTCVYDYRGFNLLFTGNNIPQSQINNGGSYDTWNKSTGVFTCVGNASAAELFDFMPIP